MERQLTDKKGYDELYQERTSTLRPFSSSADFMQAFEERHMSPYYLGGSTKGYVRGRAIEAFINDANQISNQLGDVTVLDAGSGFGELSAYLALRGFNVIGVDISKEFFAFGFSSTFRSASISISSMTLKDVFDFG